MSIKARLLFVYHRCANTKLNFPIEQHPMLFLDTSTLKRANDLYPFQNSALLIWLPLMLNITYLVLSTFTSTTVSVVACEFMHLH